MTTINNIIEQLREIEDLNPYVIQIRVKELLSKLECEQIDARRMTRLHDCYLPHDSELCYTCQQPQCVCAKCQEII